MRQLKPRLARASDNWFGFGFPTGRVRNLSPGFLSPEVKFFPLQEMNEKDNFHLNEAKK